MHTATIAAPVFSSSSNPQRRLFAHCPVKNDDARRREIRRRGGPLSSCAPSSSSCSTKLTQLHTHHFGLTITVAMPFIPNTPESLLQRSDSKNPGTTCRGLTGGGKPCRRPAATSPRPSISASLSGSLSEDHYCWQHKDQAQSAETANNVSPHGLPKSKIQERTSIDTLVDRLGLLEVESPTKANPSRRRPHSAAPAVNSRISEKPSHRPSLKPEPVKTWSFLCCFGIANEEPAPRPTRNTGPKKTSSAVPTRPTKLSTTSTVHPEPPLIPTNVPPQVAHKLRVELAKPISVQDEPGYIYIFWLTSEALPSAPPEETTKSLLSPPPFHPQPGRRRISDVLQAYTAGPAPSSTDKKPILLKIGRANNVQRRMNEWRRQCGYDVTLIRFYPYVDTHSTSPSLAPSRNHSSDSASGSSSRPSLNSINTPRKVPNVHKVERMIHLELSEKRKDMGGKCSTCGKEHREWFEIEGSRAGLREVDNLIKKWVRWSESGASGEAV